MASDDEEYKRNELDPGGAAILVVVFVTASSLFLRSCFSHVVGENGGGEDHRLGLNPEIRDEAIPRDEIAGELSI